MLRHEHESVLRKLSAFHRTLVSRCAADDNTTTGDP